MENDNEITSNCLLQFLRFLLREFAITNIYLLSNILIVIEHPMLLIIELFFLVENYSFILDVLVIIFW